MHDTHPLPGEDLIVDGVRLHVVRHGREDARHPYPPIVFFHGLPTASYLWHDVMRDLEHEHRRAAPDLGGLGRSERPAGRCYDLTSQARRMWRLLDRMGMREAVLAGFELGGSMAVHM